MATTPTGITGSPRGIAHEWDGYIVQIEDIGLGDPQRELIPDQNGAIAGAVTFDHVFDVKITMIGKTAATAAPTFANDQFTYAGATYLVSQPREAGSYNGLRKWTVNGTRYDNYPSQGT